MDYFDLGKYHRRISTKSQKCQTWFNRGLIWSYAFNHEEAVTCFNKASEEDDECIMALWGTAYALGPNYNKPWEMFDEDEMEKNISRSRTAVQKAKEIATASNSAEIERALVNAIHFRYQDGSQDRSNWNLDYAQAMEEVYRQFGEDLDVAALYADALMNLTPWSLWDLRSGKPAEGARTLEVKAVLDRALGQQGGMEHPGLLHLYIHMIEMSSKPQDGLFAADALRGLVPDAGHLLHMPTHLDVQVVSSNHSAILADLHWVNHAGPLNFYSLYRMHNYHFRIYGAMFTAQSRIALETCTQLEASLPEDLLRTESPPMADWLESFLSMRLHILIRFGRWQDILSLSLPQDQTLYATTTAMTHYARTIAYANLHGIHEAESSRELFLSAFDRVPKSRTLFNNTCKDILAIAAAMLDGELAYHSGRIEEGFNDLREAIKRSDNLPYDEPWGWMQPPRHAYGALLLDQGRVEEAKGVYEADLGLDDTLPRALQHPNNVWALHGYLECLTRSRGEEDESVKVVRKQLDLASASADVDIGASCYCRSQKASKPEAFQIKPWRFNDEAEGGKV